MPHIHGQVDFVADVFIVHNNKVLLRKHDKYKAWLSVGGHIELNEDPNQAAVREVKEEVNLDVTLISSIHEFSRPEEGKELIPPRFMNRHRINDTHEHVALVYFATTESTDIIQGAREISEEIRWFSKEELSDPAFGISERQQYYARTALEEVKG
jgi:8-oxo-dGTP pyrophosphatase MutT (NUDIX family)